MRNIADPNLFYFPSYEMVKERYTDPFQRDNRHIVEGAKQDILETFERHFCAD